jgi:hypothetical protein
MKHVILLLITAVMISSFCMAEITSVASPGGASPATAGGAQPHPTLSADGSWAGVMVIVILLGFFLPAAVIGPIVNMLCPPEAPPANAHEEAHHGSTGDHGHGH